ncbi:lytic transglycosylase [Duganella sp. BJB488]|uniref:lytic transglycosylase domain-containing protein n=1 Tax=unclassified Duganella TaxID=2636909 RepID=UPI000E34438F|nr:MULTISPECIES: lytic transglycosylase domain-containing protein [unclassified Duganella]RFP09358.1 lytic transglycosylase [Duganella sp. BJB475]RFP13246.1 lytic transglycosylase [Duganella sp. BJB489]RFP17179.1 lytic transglycosylase [Duganella sp. BJB488]RFP25394.1 lytic transglycosylase [Duganella sp. BJB476]RFP31601.1 lytic transglycosylase [Duganella sp. BJB480]
MIRPLTISLAASLSLAMPSAMADCFDAAAVYQHVHPDLLRAIAWQESRGRATALHRNVNGTIDYGMMQINSIHLKDLSGYGIATDSLMDPCVSVYVAAWHLRSKMLKYGNTWDAVGSYHSETPAERDRYKRSIMRIVQQRSYAR